MYQIKYIGDPLLREKSEIVERFDDKFDVFLEEMTRIMYEKDGIGLAEKVDTDLCFIGLLDPLEQALIRHVYSKVSIYPGTWAQRKELYRI